MFETAFSRAFASPYRREFGAHMRIIESAGVGRAVNII